MKILRNGSETRNLILAVIPLALIGCAGSATHKVVTSNEGTDSSLSCETIDAEITRTQVIIDGVNEDKADISGADMVDGILWFPFNLIAKHENYKNALDAADKRIGRLNEIKKEKNCLRSAQSSDQKVAGVTSELRELNNLYKDGALTESEYQEAKKKLLEQLSQ